MNIKIYRGADQIGGSVTEISTETTRIIIDLGSELPDENGKPLTETLIIDGVTNGNKQCDAILFTHYHGDHIGMLDKALPDIPMFIGKVAKEIFLTLQKRLKSDAIDKIKETNTFEQGVSFTIGNIKITPFSVDHSAFDAYMFLIEADGKRILHTGDFRIHGFRGKAVLPMLQKYVGQVDVLIIEGTMLSRDDKTKTEHQLQLELKKYLNNFKYVFVICSSTNIDRIGSVQAATPRGKYFLCDHYQKNLLNIVSKFSGHYSSLYDFNKALVYGQNLKGKIENQGFCMLIRGEYTFPDVVNYYTNHHCDNTIILYSMWNGYLDQPNNGYTDLLSRFKHVAYPHTSGHATIMAITEVCNTVKPREAIIPIHSENRQKLSELNLEYKILYLSDGENYTL